MYMFIVSHIHSVCSAFYYLHVQYDCILYIVCISNCSTHNTIMYVHPFMTVHKVLHLYSGALHSWHLVTRWIQCMVMSHTLLWIARILYIRSFLHVTACITLLNIIVILFSLGITLIGLFVIPTMLWVVYTCWLHLKITKGGNKLELNWIEFITNNRNNVHVVFKVNSDNTYSWFCMQTKSMMVSIHAQRKSLHTCACVIVFVCTCTCRTVAGPLYSVALEII